MYEESKLDSINGQELYKGAFVSEKGNKKATENSVVFLFLDTSLLIIDNTIPTYDLLNKRSISNKNLIYFGYINEVECFAGELNEQISNDIGEFVNLRQTYTILKTDFLKAAIFAYQIISWNKKTKFCGVCGNLNENSDSIDWVKTCPNCNETYYPKISPAIIVAIKKDNKLLMAHHKRMTNRVFSILAGFVSPGESLEECIHREVKEEAGIEIKNIEYYGSQPWPFPDSLMIGFKAEYKSGELKPDLTEITELKWFKPDEIPEWPDRSSIARVLIDDFISNSK